MKFSTTILFLCLFAAVFSFYWLTRPRPMSEMPEEKFHKVESEKVFDYPAGNTITWLQIQNLENNEVVTLVQEEKDWFLKFPVPYDADDRIVHQMIDDLRKAKRKNIYEPEKDWEEYGLLQPKLKVGVEMLNQPGRFYLLFGDMSPVDQMIFARWEHEEGYFVVSPALKSSFQRSLYSLREKKVFREKADLVSKLTFQVEAKLYEMEKKGTLWIWTQPEGLSHETLDPEEAELLLYQIWNLYIKDFLDKADDSPGQYGISEKGDFFRLSFQDGEPKTLYLGSEYPGRDSFFAKLSDENQILFLDRGKIRGLLESIDLMIRRREATLV